MDGPTYHLFLFHFRVSGSGSGLPWLILRFFGDILSSSFETVKTCTTVECPSKFPNKDASFFFSFLFLPLYLFSI